MPPPKDVVILRSFIGMVNYYSSFLPALHGVCAPLNNLDAKWSCTQEFQAAFNKLKPKLGSCFTVPLQPEHTNRDHRRCL